MQHAVRLGRQLGAIQRTFVRHPAPAPERNRILDDLASTQHVSCGDVLFIIDISAPIKGVHLLHAGDTGMSRQSTPISVLGLQNGAPALAGSFSVGMSHIATNRSVDKHLVEHGISTNTTD